MFKLMTDCNGCGKKLFFNYLCSLCKHKKQVEIENFLLGCSIRKISRYVENELENMSNDDKKIFLRKYVDHFESHQSEITELMEKWIEINNKLFK